MALADAVSTLTQRLNQQSTIADRVAAEQAASQKDVIEASKRLENAADAQMLGTIEESRALEAEEERLTGGVRGQRTVAMAQAQLYNVAEQMNQIREEDANRTGSERLWDNIIKLGTGSTPGERVIGELSKQQEQLRVQQQALRNAADNAISLFKTSQNSKADELAAITANAQLKQQGAGIRAQAIGTIGNAQLNAAETSARAAESGVRTTQMLNQDARQTRLDNLQIAKFEADEKERLLRSKDATKNLEDAMALNTFIAQESGMPEYAVSQMSPDKKTSYGIVLRASKIGQPIDPEVFEKNPELRALVYNQEQRRTTVQLDKMIPAVSALNDRYVQALDKTTKTFSAVPLSKSTQNPFSWTNPPKFVDPSAPGVVVREVTPYLTYVAPIIDSAVFGENPKDGKSDKGISTDNLDILLSNDRVMAATKTQVGQYWMNQIVTDGGSDEGLLMEAKKYPGGLVDLFKLKESLAVAGSRMIPGHLLGHEVEPTFPATIYKLESGGWTGQVSLDKDMARLPVGQEGFQKWLELLENNNRVEAEFQRAQAAKALDLQRRASLNITPGMIK